MAPTGQRIVRARPSINPQWPLVLLPGTLCDARVFDRWLDAMTLRARPVLQADMTGCDSARALALRVLATAPVCFIPVGFSLGAIVALELAVIAPARIGISWMPDAGNAALVRHGAGYQLLATLLIPK